MIQTTREGEIARVTIARPAKRNALDLPMWTALAEAMEAASADDAVRCVLIEGEGEDALSSGADIGAFERERGTPEREAVYAREISRGFQSIRTCRHPVVAACRGWTMGGGCGIATMSDFRVGGPGTRMGIPARNLSLFYHYGELDPLLQMVGYAVTCELLIEGRVFTGEEAFAKGLLSRLVPDEQVKAEAMALARRIAEGAPLSNRFHKAALQRLRGPLPLTQADLDAVNGFAFSEDFREATRAFLEKRKPVWKGR
ncbi:enoyl-CoA hydratase/isomerase family protein [Leptolyngbya sp. 15MV]|nr:enoyl-CoA hydratase/isomerase family protein [Leptolyngbya sp. 15MV]